MRLRSFAQHKLKKRLDAMILAPTPTSLLALCYHKYNSQGGTDFEGKVIVV
jgi:hypothetical protein